MWHHDEIHPEFDPGLGSILLSKQDAVILICREVPAILGVLGRVHHGTSQASQPIPHWYSPAWHKGISQESPARSGLHSHLRRLTTLAHLLRYVMSRHPQKCDSPDTMDVGSKWKKAVWNQTWPNRVYEDQRDNRDTGGSVCQSSDTQLGPFSLLPTASPRPLQSLNRDTTGAGSPPKSD